MKTSILKYRVYLFLIYLFVGINLEAQPVNNQVGDVILPAPNAAALGKYSDIPVSYHTGIPNISVPITSAHSGPLSLGVSLNYHASGIKVAETASWVGLGWSLNAGGVITRVIQGQPDDDQVKYGYYHDGAELDPQSPYHFQEVNRGLRDPEPDIFSFNFNGMSGKFYFDGDGDGDGDGEQTPVFIPKQDFLLEEFTDNNGKFERFIITTTDGVRYIFGKTMDGGTSAIEKTYSIGEDQQFKNSSYYLVKVETPDQLYSIELNYTQEHYTYINPSSTKYVYTICADQTGNNYTQGPLIPNYMLKTTVSGYRLASITTDTEDIQFIAENDREDLDPRVGYNPMAKRLDKIEVSSGDICKRYEFSYEYFKDVFGTKPPQSGNVDKRLKLTQVQEKACNNTNLIVPPYKFTYDADIQGQFQFLPHRLDKSIDHWGYYNNSSINNTEGVNAPYTEVYDKWGALVYIYDNGVVDRESHEGRMKKGVLKKIVYPTGGHTEFEFEANRIKALVETPENYLVTLLADPVINCGNPITVTGQCVIPSPKEGLKYHTWFKETNCTNPPDFNPVLKIYENGNPIPIVDIELDDTQDVIGGDFESLIGDLDLIEEGETYFFELTAITKLSGFRLYHTTFVDGEKVVGGLRVKEIRTHDGISTANDIVKSYNYQGEDGFSSGQVNDHPRYGYYLEGGFIGDQSSGGSGSGTEFVLVDAASIVINDQSIVPLGSFNGIDVGYLQVKESHSGNGTQQFIFSDIGTGQNYGQYGYSSFPIAPVLFHSNQGKQLESYILKENENTAIASTLNTPLPEEYDDSQGLMVKIGSILCPTFSIPLGGGFGTPGSINFWEFYHIRTGAYRLERVESMLDGVVTITDYEYDDMDRFLFPTASEFTNSDGKVHRTESIYIHDYTECSSVADEMVKKNMINTPFQVINRVDGIPVRGAKTLFKFFNSSGNYAGCNSANNFPRPHEFFDWEMNIDGNGFPGDFGFELNGTIDSYHGDGTPGQAYAKQFTKNHWEPEIYEWENGMIKERNFSNFKWEYSYKPGTRLVESITDVDGQSADYDYDELGRLINTSARGGAVSTEYDYYYAGNLPFDKNYVHSVTTFDEVGGSELTALEDYQYLDGLGRLMQTVKVQYSPDEKDVVNGVAYDGAGRLTIEYIPIESPGGGGAFVDIPSGTPGAVTAYEASPLNRVVGTTPPGGFSTLIEYMANDGSEVPPGSGNNYPALSLYKKKITDPNDNVTEVYSDIKGRTLINKVIGFDGIEAITSSFYDDKDRVNMIVPPDATQDDAGLIYTYEYDRADNVIEKKIPDAEPVSMIYNDRDLNVFLQDGNMAVANKWLLSKYDVYGRVTATGFYTGGTGNPNNDNLSFSQPLTESHYGTIGNIIEIDKVVLSRTMNLEDNSWLQTEFEYDGYGRVINQNGNNHLNPNFDAETYAFGYDLGDNLLSNTRTHQIPNNLPLNIYQNHTYDHSGRQIETTHKVGNEDAVVVSEKRYNQRDFMIRNKLGKADNGAFLQNVDYKYNTPGWLIAINDLSEIIGEPLGNCDDDGGEECPDLCDYSIVRFCSDNSGLTGLFINGDELVPLPNYPYLCSGGTTNAAQLETDITSWLTNNGFQFQDVTVGFFESTFFIDIIQTEVIFSEIRIEDYYTGAVNNYPFTQSNCIPDPNCGQNCDEICDYIVNIPCGNGQEIYGISVEGNQVINLNYPYGCKGGTAMTVQLTTDLQNWLNNNGVQYQGVSVALVDGYLNISVFQSDLKFLHVIMDAFPFGNPTIYEFTAGNCSSGLVDDNGVSNVSAIHPISMTVEYDLVQLQEDSDNQYSIRLSEKSQYFLKDGKAGTLIKERSTPGKLESIVLPNVMEIDLSDQWLYSDNKKSVYQAIHEKINVELFTNGLNDQNKINSFSDAVVEMLNNNWGKYPSEKLGPTTPNPDIFAMNISYFEGNDVVGAPGQFNGNISGLDWVSVGLAPQTYGFWYDGLDRLKKAAFADVAPDGAFAEDNKYGVDITYADERGNIEQITRRGFTGTCTAPDGSLGYEFGGIDHLTYEYAAGTNKLSKISEGSLETHGFKGTGGGNGFDPNGNMISAGYKGVDYIEYNYLNLPDVFMHNDGTIHLKYDASGIKHQKRVVSTDPETESYIKDYFSGIEYKDGELEAIYFSDGRVVKKEDEFVYEYSIRDHLGNTRITFSDLNENGILENLTGNEDPDEPGLPYSEILQQNHYYPFGMNMEGPWDDLEPEPENQYQYNGKELNEDFGLNWNDYGARWYDASIGRWGQVDPLVGKMPSWSPFNFSFNNPIRFIDPDGKMPIDPPTSIYLTDNGNGSTLTEISVNKTRTEKIRNGYTYATVTTTTTTITAEISETGELLSKGAKVHTNVQKLLKSHRMKRFAKDRSGGEDQSYENSTTLEGDDVQLSQQSMDLIETVKVFSESGEPNRPDHPNFYTSGKANAEKNAEKAGKIGLGATAVTLGCTPCGVVSGPTATVAAVSSVVYSLHDSPATVKYYGTPPGQNWGRLDLTKVRPAKYKD